MASMLTFFPVLILIILVWVLIEFKRTRHKVFAIFLIIFILVSYFSASYIFRNEDINLGTLEGVSKVVKIYVSWLGTVFANLKLITSNAIEMNWRPENKTEYDT